MACNSAASTYWYRSPDWAKSTPFELTASSTSPDACIGDSHCNLVEERKTAGTSEASKRHQVDAVKWRPSMLIVVPPRVGPMSGCALATSSSWTKLNVTASIVVMPPAYRPTATAPAVEAEGVSQLTLFDEITLARIASSAPNVHHVS